MLTTRTSMVSRTARPFAAVGVAVVFCAAGVAAAEPSPQAQEMLELINRTRADPKGELTRLTTSLGTPATAADGNVNSSLRYFNVSGPALVTAYSTLTPAPPLAWNNALAAAADLHNQKQNAANTQSHQLPGEAPMFQRVLDQGYTTATWLVENVYAYTTSPIYGHSGFMIDWCSCTSGLQVPAWHRDNTMIPYLREVGVGIMQSTGGLGPLITTIDFGSRTNLGNPFILGTVFTDRNANGRYDAGEGTGGVTVRVRSGSQLYQTTTLTAGGWQIQVPPGVYRVEFSGGGVAGTVCRGPVAVGNNNVKVAFVGPACCLADVNGSGSLTVQDVFSFLGAFFRRDPSGDYNGVGGVSLQDLFDFIKAYSVGCP